MLAQQRRPFGSKPGAGGLRSVVAATAEQLRFTHCFATLSRCSRRFRVAATTERSPPATSRQTLPVDSHTQEKRLGPRRSASRPFA